MRDKIQHIVPTGHVYRERNLAWFMTGVFHSRSVHTSRVANKIPDQAHRESRTRRLNRFLDNGGVRVREWYQPTASRLLQEAAQTGVIRLIMDGTKVAQNHQFRTYAITYKLRFFVNWQAGNRLKFLNGKIKQTIEKFCPAHSGDSS
jgi:hypothetical protein